MYYTTFFINTQYRMQTKFRFIPISAKEKILQFRHNLCYTIFGEICAVNYNRRIEE